MAGQTLIKPQNPQLQIELEIKGIMKLMTSLLFPIVFEDPISHNILHRFFKKWWLLNILSVRNRHVIPCIGCLSTITSS